jgi:hypothetical protein
MLHAFPGAKADVAAPPEALNAAAAAGAPTHSVRAAGTGGAVTIGASDATRGRSLRAARNFEADAPLFAEEAVGWEGGDALGWSALPPAALEGVLLQFAP